jgi:hypothetical protein
MGEVKQMDMILVKVKMVCSLRNMVVIQVTRDAVAVVVAGMVENHLMQ